MEEKTILIGVHVDTFEGMKKGVPVLLELFNKHKIKSSFFVPMGKDHTGRTIKRVFRRKGFLNKEGTGRIWADALSKKTLMYGLFLPGPSIAERNSGLLQRITSEGHELGIHGGDHVHWHDRIKGMGQKETEEEIERCLLTYRQLVGAEARSFASPGWMTNAHALRYFEEKGLAYTSDTRMGRGIFYPSMDGDMFRILQVPTTLRTLDEVIGSHGNDVAALVDYYCAALSGGLNVLTVHAEIEGGRWRLFLEQFVQKTLSMGYRFKRLIEVAEACRQSPGIPVCPVQYGFVEGRAGEVCLQGETLQTPKDA